MELSTSSWMLIFFVALLIVSIWKIYAFLPNKPLVDDDTTKESQEELLKVILKVIKESQGELSREELFANIKEDETFDEKKFWRFNQNRLNQLLSHYHLENPHTKNIADIYKDLKD
ncbi:MAG: hypothetical protein M0Q24_06825 [Sulfurimonas sp.]|uniref:hypothetical protein n=1 Tax=Sulfurimonas sp. TaxID=2022749 RepID=UPI0025EA7D3F|nr:hypothetical protein [Sulfurimonas sp.]MCK9491787.1 hypothetical protein [Sulfurimonas sp.]